jgi:integrase
MRHLSGCWPDLAFLSQVHSLTTLGLKKPGQANDARGFATRPAADSSAAATQVTRNRELFRRNKELFSWSRKFWQSKFKSSLDEVFGTHRSIDSTHYLERDELAGLKRLQKEQEPKSAHVFVNERGDPFKRMGIARMIERAGEEAKIGFPVHVHCLRHSTGFALAAKGTDTRRLQHYLGHASITNTVRYTAMSPEPFKDIWKK